ncbi:MAG: hypothetical protein QY330_01200 [Candidatus Dojkabacteria bacterium]|uniref:Carbohydrate kinase PfkB domain-containing protein n=2 Tax=Candidatus Dojkabacteria TaxID=74243 RepID=A0A136KL44_9BACT|nr:MAG: hypothetical protein UZ20_WS6002000061 [candidate division WS6 bacterium OLB21]MBW7953458.1 hypothetical protein [Candidatus Dojkabacteria bacterium]WKZ28207.1 MAG: hypothetical protein QY330_01200 [Candidatus Dojkabacteria bacterium]
MLEVLSPETKNLLGMRPESISALTIIVLDLSLPVESNQIVQLELGESGWTSLRPEEIDPFLERFETTFGESLIVTLQDADNDHLRLGGTSYTTAKQLAQLLGINRFNCHAPVGNSDQPSKDEGLGGVIQERFNELITLEAGLTLTPSNHDAPVPLIISFNAPGEERKMVLLPGCKDEGIYPSEEANIPNTLLILDSYELADTDSTYGKAALAQITENPTNILPFIGLGSTRVVEQASYFIQQFAGIRPINISGNKEEVELLCRVRNCSNVSELMLDLNTQILLETNGRNGATIYVNFNNEVYGVSYFLPESEIYEGDNTNAGDVFLAAVIRGLSNVDSNTDIGESLLKVLQEASTSTYNYLLVRGT